MQRYMYRVVSLGARTYSPQMNSLHQEDKKANMPHSTEREVLRNVKYKDDSFGVK